MRPVLKLANPRFINERIESLAINMTKPKGALETQDTPQSRPNGLSKITSDHFTRVLDPSGTGVELVQLKSDQPRTTSVTATTDNQNGTHISKDPLLSIDTRSTRSWNSLPMNSQNSDEKGITQHRSGGEWGDMLDMISRRKSQALAPEHFENMWTKVRNYKKKEGENRINDQIQHSATKSAFAGGSKSMSNPKEKNSMTKVNPLESHIAHNADWKKSNCSSTASYQEDEEHNLMHLEDADLGTSSSYTSEDEETDSVTGLDSPVTKVWDGKNNRNQAVSRIHHPLENSDGHISKKTGRRLVQYQRLPRAQAGRRRSRLSSQKLSVWREVERTSFLSGDGQDILSSSKGQTEVDESSDDFESEIFGRSQTGATASSASFISMPESRSLTVNSLQNSLMVDSFFKLRCEVLGTNIVKSGCRTFAVYSIAVADANNNNWSIKRRFRHFEELHRRLKFFPEYNLHLPPKRFLSTGLDVPVIQERCKLLDSYLKKLLQFPTVSGSIEVWDFLSIDSQTYVFSNSITIVETLSVDLEVKPSEKVAKVSYLIGPLTSPSSYRREKLDSESKESAWQVKDNFVAYEKKFNAKEMSHPPVKITSKEHGKSLKDSRSRPDTMVQNNSSSLRNLDKPVKGREKDSLEEASELLPDAATDPTIPTEWVPPNLCEPILDLVDVILQLQDGWWIRRKAFWVAKQVLQLGMGDAFDDWLMEKIQLLRSGSVVASGIKKLEQIIWPDGIFITKHPKRRQSPPPSSPHGCQPVEISCPRLSEEQKQEADRRAKFVYELMIDKAPAAVVGLVGRKKYEQCAKDLYFFIQSSVCLKHLAFDVLELLFLSAFPEMEYTFKLLHEEKHRFGEFKAN